MKEESDRGGVKQGSVWRLGEEELQQTDEYK